MNQSKATLENYSGTVATPFEIAGGIYCQDQLNYVHVKLKYRRTRNRSGHAWQRVHNEEARRISIP